LLIVALDDGLDYLVNHLCDPNAWMADEVTVIARRAIAANEEIVGGYAVWDSNPAHVIDPCRCETDRCRGRFDGDDWRQPDLQEHFRGHFLPYPLSPLR
jgi:hypothetical protein